MSGELAPKGPMGAAGRAAAVLAVVVVAVMWAHVLLAYGRLPEKIPTRFDEEGRPAAYGSKRSLLAMVAVFTIAPALVLAIVWFRFTLVNKYSYLVSLPAFFIRLRGLPPGERSRFVNRYFEAMSAIALLLAVLMYLLELSILKAAAGRAMAVKFIPVAVVSWVAVVMAGLILYLRRLSRELEEALKEHEAPGAAGLQA
ncbi:MAG: hypothetical protein DRN96_04295 [Thermoproteota archaeon]|nr:MAG: hypothetical protein DRN96_04295 [Candidatus Korarchaeota archaeon]